MQDIDYQKNVDIVLLELNKALNSIKGADVLKLKDAILQDDKIFFVGIG